MKVTFFGGAKSVTGANHLLEIGGKRILIDCGMQQGGKEETLWNYNDFPYDPASIDYLFLTHAHIDHIGRVPKLVREGFKGKIIATAPTIDLAKLSLVDSAGIIAREAEQFGKEPFFNMDDVQATDKYYVKHNYFDDLDLGNGIKVEILNAGHVLGSAMFRFEHEGTSITFTGDLGNDPSPLIPPSSFIEQTDYLVMESVYGNRNHDPSNIGSKLLKEIALETIERGGVLLIPSFSLERSQIVLYYLNNLIESNELPEIPVFLDSPLAIKMTEVFRKHVHYFKDEVKRQIMGGDDIFDFPKLTFTETVDDSKAIANAKSPKIIIAGNGMSTAGRILHHEKFFLSGEKNTLLVVGYQAQGSIARQIMDGAKTVKIHHKEVKAKAHLHEITAFSAHADQRQLRNFVHNKVKTKPKGVFIVQGDEEAAVSLGSKLEEDGFEVTIPEEGQSVDLF